MPATVTNNGNNGEAPPPLPTKRGSAYLDDAPNTPKVSLCVCVCVCVFVCVSTCICVSVYQYSLVVGMFH